MMKNFTTLLFAFLITCIGFAQGHETFDNLEMEGNSYQDGSFTGQDGSTWTYVKARGDADAEVNEGDQAIMLGKNKDAELESGTLNNGIGTLSFSYKQAFSSDVNLEVYINDELVYTATSSDQNGEVLEASDIPINVQGDFTIRFYNPSGGGQVNIDDVVWTAVGNEPTLTITSPTDGTQFPPGVSSVDVNFTVSNFSISSSTDAGDGDGYITYELSQPEGEAETVSGNHFSTDPIELTDLAPGTYWILADLVDNNGDPLGNSIITSDTTLFTINVAINATSIDEVRQGDIGDYFTLNNEVIVTYQQDFRNQKYIQDASGAILIDDDQGVITTTYNRYDGITGITGKLAENNGVKELQPIEDPGAATTTDNFVPPQVITIDQLMDDPDAYESQVVAFENVSFSDADGSTTFEAGNNYTVTDGSDETTMRTNFYDADYLGDVIPQGTQDAVVGIAAQFNGEGQFFIRDTDDLEGNTLSVDKVNKDHIGLYPNPATTQVHITVKGQAQVQIYSLLGQRLVNTELSGETTLPVDNLDAGIYLVRITQHGQTVTKKLIVQ